ncbi:MAG: OmpA family protein [Flavobacteriales bacterium]|nr:OmpA family protein [Flavobacteriales bacterium]
MKKLYLLLGLVFVASSLSAQNKDTKKADKYFHRFQFVKAADEYKKLVEKGKGGKYVYKQLGDTYYNMYNTDEAIQWYERVANREQTDPEVFFRYSQMLKSKGKYEESNAQMAQFARLAPNDQRAIDFNKDPNYLPSLLDIRKAFELNKLDINSDKSDFGGVLHEKTLYFTSARNTKGRIYGWLMQPYLDMYQATYEDTTFVDVKPIESLNTKFHDGPGSITKDGKTFYYSADSFLSKKYEKDTERKNKMGQVNIFVAKKEGSEWGKGEELPFNSGGYSVSNPSISADGKTLYFASNMPGGLGGLDIWKVEVKGNGAYGEPENLGDRVNTEGNESFPFIDEDGVLYFASNGRVGLGGLDVFTLNFEKDDMAVNLGKPVNSEKDDFSFSYNKEHNVAIVASNREGQDNLYLATPVCGVNLIAIVTDKETGDVLGGADVSIMDKQNNLIATNVSDEMGKVDFYVECDKGYKLQVVKEGYENGSFSSKPSKGDDVNVEAKLAPIKAIITDTEIILQEIVFEFNKSNITQDAAFILDNLVKIMNDYPEIKIEVGSHTDNRGSAKYNEKLSSQRAKSTVQYVVSKGIAESRIYGKGYGESQPKIDCKYLCNEEQHQANRRSEFKIVKETVQEEEAE